MFFKNIWTVFLTFTPSSPQCHLFNHEILFNQSQIPSSHLVSRNIYSFPILLCIRDISFSKLAYIAWWNLCQNLKPWWGNRYDFFFAWLRGGACLCTRHRNLTRRGILPLSRCAVLFQNMEAYTQNTENIDRKFQWWLKLDFFQKFLKNSCCGKVAKR